MEFEITFNDVVTLASVAVAAISVICNVSAKKKELYNAKAAALYHEKVNVYGEFMQLISASVFAEQMLIPLKSAEKLLKLIEKVLLLVDENNRFLFTEIEAKLRRYFNLSFEYQKFRNDNYAPPPNVVNEMKSILSDINNKMPEISFALRSDLAFK